MFSRFGIYFLYRKAVAACECAKNIFVFFVLLIFSPCVYLSLSLALALSVCLSRARKPSSVVGLLLTIVNIVIQMIFVLSDNNKPQIPVIYTIGIVDY